MTNDAQLQTACREILPEWRLDAGLLPTFIGSADGLALLALLANAAAKDVPALYRHKALLVGAACQAADAGHWWVDTHRYAKIQRFDWLNRLNFWWERMTGKYLLTTSMTIYFIETGLPFAGDTLQLAFHFRPGDELPDLPNAPLANGRKWRGQRAQPKAGQIALNWLADHAD
jgi:hypothetical protein